ncbi:MAG: cyclic lactone autoinducer peptide [Peptococcaceae bacterium]|nr:cyclic lactone autoinducer peptide [Peptococcaceae bacterium]
MIKKLLYSSLVFSAIFIASIGIGPASIGTWYQPVPPQR